VAKDSTNAAVAVGDTVKIVGTVLALREPDGSNKGNVVIQPTNTTLKDNNGNVIGTDARCITVSGSAVTKGS
jgi:hypothetical protein